MAQRVQIILEDDYDGSAADETVSFGLDGVEYEIDLSSTNAQELRESLAVWTAHARKTGGRRRRVAVSSGRPAEATVGSSPSDIRAWAQEQGLEVSSRGRVSAEVREAYEKAHA